MIRGGLRSLLPGLGDCAGPDVSGQSQPENPTGKEELPGAGVTALEGAGKSACPSGGAPAWSLYVMTPSGARQFPVSSSCNVADSQWGKYSVGYLDVKKINK